VYLLQPSNCKLNGRIDDQRVTGIRAQSRLK
jgi:hypothetical protein